MAIIEELAALQAQTLAAIAAAADTAALDDVRVKVLGKSGTLTAYLRNMGQVPKEERASVGKAVNEARGVVEGALEARKKELAAAELEASMDAAAVDVTLPGRAQQIGTRHLINRVTEPGELDQVLEEHFLAPLRRNSTLSVSAIKRQFRALSRDTAALSVETFERINAYRHFVYQGDDYKEGIRAFLEKREPQYKGKASDLDLDLD